MHTFENAEKGLFGDRVYSPSVAVGGLNFRILFFPRGNRADTHVSVFCDLDKASTPATDDPEFEAFTYFSIAVLRRDGTKWFSRCAILYAIFTIDSLTYIALKHRFLPTAVNFGIPELAKIHVSQ